MVDVLEAPASLEGQEVSIGESIDIALYRNMEATRTRYCAMRMWLCTSRSRRAVTTPYTPEQDQSNSDRLMLAGALRCAIASEELTLHYQPKIDCRTGAASGVKALVRWEHPQQGLITPDRFIPVAAARGWARTHRRSLVDAKTCGAESQMRGPPPQR